MLYNRGAKEIYDLWGALLAEETETTDPGGGGLG